MIIIVDIARILIDSEVEVALVLVPRGIRPAG